MIKDQILATRYGEAFLQFTQGKIGIDKALLDFKNVKDILRAHQQLKEFLESPEMSFAEKCGIIDKVFTDGFSEEIRSFLKLLIEKERIESFLDIAEYIRKKYSHAGEEDVIIKTTFPLELELIKKIEEKLRKKFKRKFKFYIDLDSNMLGGIQIIIGNKIIDGSVRKRLADLKNKLLAVQLN